MRCSRRQGGVWLAASLLAARSHAVNGAGGAGGARWLRWPAARSTPALSLTDLDGQPWTLAQEQGHPVLLNFWATWCEPCRAEMQSFDVLQQQLMGSGLKVVAVNFREGREPVWRFRQAQALTLAMVRDSYGDAARAWAVRSFPTTFVINAAGQARMRIEGELDWGSAAVQHRLRGLF